MDTGEVEAAAAFADELSVVARRWRELAGDPCVAGDRRRDEVLAELDTDQLRLAVSFLQRMHDRLGGEGTN